MQLYLCKLCRSFWRTRWKTTGKKHSICCTILFIPPTHFFVQFLTFRLALQSQSQQHCFVVKKKNHRCLYYGGRIKDNPITGRPDVKIKKKATSAGRSPDFYPFQYFLPEIKFSKNTHIYAGAKAVLYKYLHITEACLRPYTYIHTS